MASAVDTKLLEVYQTLKVELVNIRETNTLDSSQVIATASQLKDHAIDYRNAICKVDNEEEFEQVLQKKPIVILPALCALVQALGDSSLQLNDPLKQALGKTCRVLLELLVFQCAIDKRRIYSTTVNKMIETFARVESTLPEKEVECRFDMDCCYALSLKFNHGKGKWTGITKKHSAELAKATLHVLVSLNPSPPYVAVNPLIPPIIDTIKDIYKNVEHIWYAPIWALRWATIKNPIKTLDRFNQFQDSFKVGSLIPKIRYFVAELLFEIAKNASAEDAVRLAAFQGDRISLKTLSEPVFLIKKIDPWETRYQIVTYLRTLLQIDLFKDVCYEILLKCQSSKERTIIRNAAIITLADLASKYENLGTVRQSLQNQAERFERAEVENEIRHYEPDNESSSDEDITIIEECTGKEEGDVDTDKLSTCLKALSIFEALDNINLKLKEQ